MKVRTITLKNQSKSQSTYLLTYPSFRVAVLLKIHMIYDNCLNGAVFIYSLVVLIRVCINFRILHITYYHITKSAKYKINSKNSVPFLCFTINVQMYKPTQLHGSSGGDLFHLLANCFLQFCSDSSVLIFPKLSSYIQ